jgi:subtilisin family serine protease
MGLRDLLRFLQKLWARLLHFSGFSGRQPFEFGSATYPDLIPEELLIDAGIEGDHANDRGKFMRYRDKSSNTTVVLSESRNNFLILTEAGDQESVAPVLMNQKVFRVTPSNNNDGVFIFEARSDQESAIELERAVGFLKAEEGVKEVVPALVGPAGEVRYALPHLVVVRFKGISDAAVRKYLTSVHSRIVRSFGSGLHEVALPKGVELSDFVDTLNENANVQFAEPSFYGVNDQEVRVQVAPNYPLIRVEKGPGQEVLNPPDPVPGETEPPPPSSQSLAWNLMRIDLPKAWKLTTGKQDVVIGVVDGRPDVQHEALLNKFLVPLSDDLVFSADDSISSHATQVSGIAAGESTQLFGVAPGVRLLPLIVNLNSQSYAERAGAILKAAELARDQKVGDVPFSRMVLSCSWRTNGDVASIRTALEDAIEANILVVFSAGNDGVNAPHFPSDYSQRPGILEGGIVAVAATDIHDNKATYSNFSASVDVCAPGGDGLPLDDGDIFCADLAGVYAFSAGTSLAAPHVAGVAALMLSINPELTPAQLKQILKTTADNISDLNPELNNLIGSGRLNATAAVKAVTDLNGNGAASELDLVAEKLKQYSRALEDATGWSLTAAQVVKGNSTHLINLS